MRREGPSVVCFDRLIGQTAAGLEVAESTVFVQAHHAAESHHVGRENCGKLTSWSGFKHKKFSIIDSLFGVHYIDRVLNHALTYQQLSPFSLRERAVVRGKAKSYTT